MSTVRLPQALAIAAVATLFSLTSAAAAELSSFKDRLFAYPGVLEQADDGAFLKIDYDKMRDIHQRDEIPERRVKGRYVALGVRWRQDYETIEHKDRSIEVFTIGKLRTARFAVIFVHGRGGDRKLGANDFTFGGNFNRLKNLADDNNGIYFAPSARDFGDDGTADVAALVDFIHQAAPKAQIVLSCASMGTFICWKITNDRAAVDQLSGMMILGGPPDAGFPKSAAHAAKLPIFFSHGSDDTVYPWQEQHALYESLIAEGYPARFVLFNTGSHGTPIRMTDWRDTLNWILK